MRFPLRVLMPHLSTAQRHQILVEWNDTRPNDAFKVGLHHVVRVRALRHPNALAVDDGHHRLTMGEVVRAASGLADQLRRLGVKPEDLVAYQLEPSAAMAWASLGILEAGAVCLPLDPHAPLEHRAAVLADAAPRIVLYERALPTHLTEGPWDLLDLRSVEPVVSPPPLLDPKFSPHRLAYVLYPAPGRNPPIGTAIPHQMLANLAHCNRRSLGLRPGVRTSQVAALDSLPALREIWPSLVSGAQLHIAPQGARESSRSLDNWLAQARVEALPPSYSKAPILEQAINSKSCRPFPGARLYVLDQSLQPVPLGTIGEIFLAGLVLPRGYHGLPAETAERFVPRPFGEPTVDHEDGHLGQGDRLYRTGERGCFLPHGVLEVLAEHAG